MTTYEFVETFLLAKTEKEDLIIDKEAANDFYESFRAELTLYDSADNYMRNVLQKRYDPKKTATN